MLFVVLCPGTPGGSTSSGSGFKASQKTGQIVQKNTRMTWNLILKFFSLLILVVEALYLMNPTDATLASVSVSKYSRWRPKWPSIRLLSHI